MIVNFSKREAQQSPLELGEASRNDTARSIAPRPAGPAKEKMLHRRSAKDRRMKTILKKHRSSAEGPSRVRRPDLEHSETESSDDELVPKSQLRKAQRKIRSLEDELERERKVNRRLTNGLLQEIGRALCTVVTSQMNTASTNTLLVRWFRVYSPDLLLFLPEYWQRSSRLSLIHKI